MILIVIGGRDYSNYTFVKKHLGFMKLEKIITTGENGAGLLARRFAEENKIPLKVYKADEELHGRKAKIIRDEKMLKENREAVVLALPGGKDTEACLKIAEELKMMRIC